MNARRASVLRVRRAAAPLDRDRARALRNAAIADLLLALLLAALAPALVMARG